jgi:hypothetical protein
MTSTPAQSPSDAWAVKVKAPGMNRWALLSSGGYTTMRRVQALVFPRVRAEQAAADICATWPGWKAKAVRLYPRRRA